MIGTVIGHTTDIKEDTGPFLGEVGKVFGRILKAKVGNLGDFGNLCGFQCLDDLLAELRIIV